MTIAKFSITITLLLFVVSASSSASQTTHTPQQQTFESDATEAATYPNYEEYAPLMLSRVNKEREVNGLPPLCANKKLRRAAQRYCYDDLYNYDYIQNLEHQRVSQYVIEAGYACDGRSQSPTFNCGNVGSNANPGESTVDAFVNEWMRRPGSKLILGNFSHIGFEYAFNNDTFYKHYWTQVFATGNTEECDGEFSSSGGQLIQDVVTQDPASTTKTRRPQERCHLPPSSTLRKQAKTATDSTSTRWASSDAYVSRL